MLYTFFGLPLLVQNVYPYIIRFLDPFLQVESWIPTHGLIPMLVRLLVPCALVGQWLCYIWESQEVAWGVIREFFGIPSIAYALGQFNVFYGFSNWLGSETPADSLLGDMLQGTLAVLWGSYFMYRAGVPNLFLLLYYPTWKRMLWRIVVFLIQMYTSVSATIFLIRDIMQPLYYSSVEEWWNAPLWFNIIPIGWVVWVCIILPVLMYYGRYLDLQLAQEAVSAENADDENMGYKSPKEAVESVKLLYSYIFGYFILHTLLCSTFLIPTYFTYWFGQLLCLLYFFVLNRMSGFTWRRFAPYLFFGFFPYNFEQSAVNTIQVVYNRRQKFENMKRIRI